MKNMNHKYESIGILPVDLYQWLFSVRSIQPLSLMDITFLYSLALSIWTTISKRILKQWLFGCFRLLIAQKRSRPGL